MDRGCCGLWIEQCGVLGSRICMMMVRSVTEEGDDAIADVAKHAVEFLLGVEPVVLAQSSIVVADVLEDLLVEAAAHWGDDEDAGGDTCDDVGGLDH